MDAGALVRRHNHIGWYQISPKRGLLRQSAARIFVYAKGDTQDNETQYGVYFEGAIDETARHASEVALKDPSRYVDSAKTYSAGTKYSAPDFWVPDRNFKPATGSPERKFADSLAKSAK